MTNIDLEELMTFAEATARDAGACLMAGAQDPRAGLATKASPLDVVTATDTAAEQLVVERIAQAYPHDAILGEEGSSIEGTTDRRWIIDPLDGTLNFVNGWRVSAVSIGIEINNVFTSGVVFNPLQDELFRAALGIGAFFNNHRVFYDAKTKLNRGIIGIDGGYEPWAKTQRASVVPELIRHGDIRCIGSTSLGLCHVAMGRMDGYLNIGSSIWDIAAGTAIAREAGYTVQGATPNSEPTGDHAIAGTPEIVSWLQCLLSNHLPG